MLLFSINRSRGYENPSLDIIVIDLFSTGGFPLKEAVNIAFRFKVLTLLLFLYHFSVIVVNVLGYIVVILPLLAFYFCSAYILYLVYHITIRSGLQNRMHGKFPLKPNRVYLSG
jgi:hypothetical protein